MGAYASYIVETFVTLLVVCGVAFVVLYGARRLGIGRPTGPVRLLGHLPLDPRRAIYLVGVGKQIIVVGASEAGLTKLGEVSSAELPEGAVANGSAPSFADVFSRALGRRTKAGEGRAP